MEKGQQTPPKRTFYLIDAKMPNNIIRAKVLKHTSTLQYGFNDNIVTMEIIRKIRDHVYESSESVYVIIDKSL